jgi:hypothetical protein
MVLCMVIGGEKWEGQVRASGELQSGSSEAILVIIIISSLEGMCLCSMLINTRQQKK